MTETIDDLMTRRPKVEFAVELSPACIEEFQMRGFASIDRITTDEELAWLGEIYDRLFAERVAPLPGAYVELMRTHEAGRDAQSQIIMPEVRFAELRQTVLWRNGRALAAQLMAVDASMLRGWGHMIRKPPLDDGALPWHQDEAYWDPAFDYHALACWMPLDPATVESGCMSFIPDRIAATCGCITASVAIIPITSSMPKTSIHPWRLPHPSARAAPCSIIAERCTVRVPSKPPRAAGILERVANRARQARASRTTALVRRGQKSSAGASELKTGFFSSWRSRLGNPDLLRRGQQVSVLEDRRGLVPFDFVIDADADPSLLAHVRRNEEAPGIRVDQ